MNEQNLQIFVALLSCLATLAILMVGFLYNNSRLNDYGARLNDMRDLLRAEMARNQSELLMKFSELDRRLSALEK